MRESDLQKLDNYDEMLKIAKELNKPDVMSAIPIMMNNSSKNMAENIYRLNEERILSLLEYGEFYQTEPDTFWIIEKSGHKRFGFSFDGDNFRFLSTGAI